MYAATQVLVGLLVAHIAWLFFFLTGLLVEPAGTARPDNAGRALLRIVIATAVGFAICGFEGFALGLVGLLTVPGILIMVCVNLGAFHVIRRENPLSKAFWMERHRDFRAALSIPSIVLYDVMLILSTHAAMPDVSSDGVRIHLAYAYEWFREGHIYADYRFRFPYYAFNYEILYAWMFVARVGRYIPFLNWLAGTVACLGIYGIIASINEQTRRVANKLWFVAENIVYIALPLSVVASAVFLRWTDTAMEDTATGMFFLAVIAAVVLSVLSANRRHLPAAVFCLAFLAGMKPSFAVFVPVACAFLFLVLRKNMPAGKLLAMILLLCALSSTWYIKNWIQDGDPVPPVFNLMFRGHDPNFTKAQWQAIENDLHTKRTFSSLAAYPWRVFTNPLSLDFREYGVTAVIFSLYAILGTWIYFLVKTRRSQKERAITCLLMWALLGVAYIFASSTLVRYSLLFYPTMAAAGGSVLLYFAQEIPYGIFIAPILAITAIFPSPNSSDFYSNFQFMGYTALSDYMPSDDAFLDRNLAAYAEARGILDSRALKQPQYNTVLLVQAELNYYVELHGAHAFGDWFGPGSYQILAAAIDSGNAMGYMNANKIGAIVIDTQSGALAPDEVQFLRRQILKGGFREASTSDAHFEAFERKI